MTFEEMLHRIKTANKKQGETWKCCDHRNIELKHVADGVEVKLLEMGFM